MTIFLSRLLQLLNEKGISENKILTELQLNTNSFNNWRTRDTIPGGDTLSKFADFFDCSIDFILGRTDVREMAPSITDPLLNALIQSYRVLNEEGREILVDHADTMVSSEKYIKTNSVFLDAEKGVI